MPFQHLLRSVHWILRETSIIANWIETRWPYYVCGDGGCGVCVCRSIFGDDMCIVLLIYAWRSAPQQPTNTERGDARRQSDKSLCVCKSRHLDNDIVADDLSAKHDECVLLLSSICGKASLVSVSVCEADSIRIGSQSNIQISYESHGSRVLRIRRANRCNLISTQHFAHTLAKLRPSAQIRRIARLSDQRISFKAMSSHIEINCSLPSNRHTKLNSPTEKITFTTNFTRYLFAGHWTIAQTQIHDRTKFTESLNYLFWFVHCSLLYHQHHVDCAKHTHNFRIFYPTILRANTFQIDIHWWYSQKRNWVGRAIEWMSVPKIIIFRWNFVKMEIFQCGLFELHQKWMNK